jgi:hypothetical protein
VAQVAAVAASTLLLSVVVAGGWLLGDFDQRTQPISALGALGAETRGIYTVALLAVGALTCVVAVSWWHLAWFRGPALVLLTELIGVTILGLAAVPCSERCPIPGTRFSQPIDVAHTIVSAPLFVGAIVLGIAGWRCSPHGHPFRRLSGLVAVAGVVVVPIFLIVHRSRSHDSDGLEHAGEWERVLVGLLLTWMVMATFMMKREPRAATGPPLEPDREQ